MSSGLSHFVTEMTSSQPQRAMLYLSLKRVLDVVLSLIALILFAPLFLIIAIAIKLDSPGPVIYCQKRVRGNQDPMTPHAEENVFDFYKFRSMYVNADPSIHQNFVREYINGNTKINNGTKEKPLYKMKDDPRITRVGRFIRQTSLDELPQLINVLKGDMSLVGPRPALPYEVMHYSAEDRQRLTPQAGLTGLWQVSGRTTLTFREMIRLDIEYAQRRSLALDLKILLKTLPAIISRHGAW